MVRAALQSTWNRRRHLGLYQCFSLDHFLGRNQGISLYAGSREAGLGWRVTFSAENGKI